MLSEALGIFYLPVYILSPHPSFSIYSVPGRLTLPALALRLLGGLANEKYW